jgi:ParB family chromosome partitioning protein
MSKTGAAGSNPLAGFDSIFDSNSDRNSVVMVQLSELRSPEFHPFHVSDDAAMDRLVKSVTLYGVREPGIVRPLCDGGFELIAGNRRKRACELAGLSAMPVIVREMDDDSAAIAMVDSNLEQREKLLPSEKAWAYRVKMEALNHRGSKSEDRGLPSVEVICEQTGESRNTVFRIVKLTDLVPDLLDMVDENRLAFNPGVELSYLSRVEQQQVFERMEKYQTKPTLAQSIALKKASQDGDLTAERIDSILSVAEQKKNDRRTAAKKFKDFFPESYSPEQMEAVIIDLLTEWRRM